jgi:outer membrane protein OmpA-like peptidoglycan-associated protein
LGANLDEISAGLGLVLAGKPFGLQFDYAFSYPLQLTGTTGSHRLGLTIFWDPQPQPGARNQKVKRRKTQLDQQTQFARPQMEQLQPMRAVQPVPLPQPAPTQPSGNLAQAQTAAEPMPEGQPNRQPENTQKFSLQAEMDYFKERQKIGMLKPIGFKSGQAKLGPASIPTLDYLGEILARYPGYAIQIKVKAEAKGSAAARKKLAQRRAGSVRIYLLAHFSSLTAKQLIPVAGTETKFGQGLVEFEIAGE